MAARILAIINRCKECPNRQYSSGGIYQCVKVGADLDDREIMPAWCPLPLYPVSNTNMTNQNSAAQAASLPSRRPLSQTRLKAKQVSVRILDQELANSNLNSISAIPLFFGLHEEWPPGLRQILKKRAQLGHLNLEIYASAQRSFERPRDPLPAISKFFKHDLRAIEVQICKALFISAVGDGKAAEVYPKPLADCHVADEQFRHKSRTTKFQVHSPLKPVSIFYSDHTRVIDRKMK